SLQFVRYASRVARRGGRVLLGCEPNLSRLLAQVPGVAQVIVPGALLPALDYQCLLPSLPRVLATDLHSIPADVPYLHALPPLVQAWRDKLGPRRGLRVGLAWAGNPEHKNDRNRSIALSQLAALGTVRESISFYSLQKGPAVQQIGAVAELSLIDHTQELNDFADTAALVANLDLVIT